MPTLITTREVDVDRNKDFIVPPGSDPIPMENSACILPINNTTQTPQTDLELKFLAD
jgi:hypothetical protein